MPTSNSWLAGHAPVSSGEVRMSQQVFAHQVRVAIHASDPITRAGLTSRPRQVQWTHGEVLTRPRPDRDRRQLRRTGRAAPDHRGSRPREDRGGGPLNSWSAARGRARVNGFDE
jgi:hypothetical protein